jgi:hypothetical protein
MGERVQILRVVVASPGDVIAERATVSTVLEDLNRSVAADRNLRLEAVRWETDAYPGFHPDGPQGLIDPILRIESSDLLIGIFWKRFGMPTKDAPSGTEHEFRLAYQAWKRNGSPQVMVYFNQKPYTPQSKEEIDQWGRVLEFRKSFPPEGLWSLYRGASQFERLLRMHLTNFIRSRVETSGFRSDSQSQSMLQAEQRPADYFAIQKNIIELNARTHVGRLDVQHALEHFLEDQTQGYFIVRGMPGQGKTAFACQLVRDKGFVHHFVSFTGGRAEPRLILRSLLSQLIPRAAPKTTIPESIPELTKLWEELLARAAQDGPVVVVIDGIDELASPVLDETPYLTTEGLPRGAYVVVTARPGERLDCLKALVSTLPHFVYDLRPLELAEIEEIVRLRAPQTTNPNLRRIAETSQGNPLYLRAVLDELEDNSEFDLNELPSTVEGFYRHATAHLSDSNNESLRSVVGLLAVSRKPLSIRELHQITGASQRELHDRGIGPIRHFLGEADGAYWFYHASFHDFVIGKLIFEDELRSFHSRLATWLELRSNHDFDYRWMSLTHHLFEACERARLVETISQEFLIEKGRRFGYAVLEDIEILSRVLLDTGDPASVEACVNLVEGLRQVVGDDVTREATRAVRGERTRAKPSSLTSSVIATSVRNVRGLDVYVGSIPAGEITADFFEIIPRNEGLTVAIGDAPSSGLKSAFVARFMGNLFRNFVGRADAIDLGRILSEINATIAPFDYFERVSMQCIDVDTGRRLCEIANAGHPDPVLYSARRGKCDILHVPGDLLHDSFRQTRRIKMYDQYSAEVAAGDILILLTDGLTEGHQMMGDPYGYRFTRVVEEKACLAAREIGEAILQDWRMHSIDEEYSDDLMIVVIVLRRKNGDVLDNS